MPQSARFMHYTTKEATSTTFVSAQFGFSRKHTDKVTFLFNSHFPSIIILALFINTKSRKYNQHTFRNVSVSSCSKKECCRRTQSVTNSIQEHVAFLHPYLISQRLILHSKREGKCLLHFTSPSRSFQNKFSFLVSNKS